MVGVTIFIAFAAGILSFLSPCVLPIIPGFLGYLAGTSAVREQTRGKLFLHSLCFVLGFAAVFAVLGVLLNSVLKHISVIVQVWLSRVSGVIIILFGFYVLELVRLPFLERDYRLNVTHQFSFAYVTSFVFGAAFAVGWTPCVSAILGSILALVVAQPSQAFVLLLAYALGLGVPFLLVGLFTKQAFGLIRRSQKMLRYFNLVVGILLILLGVFVFTNTLTIVANVFVPMSWLI